MRVSAAAVELVLCPDEFIYQACRLCRLMPYYQPSIAMLWQVERARMLVAMIRKESGP